MQADYNVMFSEQDTCSIETYHFIPTTPGLDGRMKIMGEESAFLIRLVGEPLKICLKDVVETRPRDPIEYIAQWLYSYVDHKQYFLEKYAILKNLEDEYRRMQKQKKLLWENKKKLAMQFQAIATVSNITDFGDFDGETKQIPRGTYSRGSSPKAKTKDPVSQPGGGSFIDKLNDAFRNDYPYSRPNSIRSEEVKHSPMNFSDFSSLPSFQAGTESMAELFSRLQPDTSPFLEMPQGFDSDGEYPYSRRNSVKMSTSMDSTISTDGPYNFGQVRNPLSSSRTIESTDNIRLQQDAMPGQYQMKSSQKGSQGRDSRSNYVVYDSVGKPTGPSKQTDADFESKFRADFEYSLSGTGMSQNIDHNFVVKSGLDPSKTPTQDDSGANQKTRYDVVQNPGAGLEQSKYDTPRDASGAQHESSPGNVSQPGVNLGQANTGHLIPATSPGIRKGSQRSGGVSKAGASLGPSNTDPHRTPSKTRRGTHHRGKGSDASRSGTTTEDHEETNSDFVPKPGATVGKSKPGAAYVGQSKPGAAYVGQSKPGADVEQTKSASPLVNSDLPTEDPTKLNVQGFNQGLIKITLESPSPNFSSVVIGPCNPATQPDGTQPEIAPVTWEVRRHDLALICQHPVLGALEPRPCLLYPETPEWWHKQGYLLETLYDHEVYSCCNSDKHPLWDTVERMTYDEFVTPGPWITADGKYALPDANANAAPDVPVAAANAAPDVPVAAANAAHDASDVLLAADESTSKQEGQKSKRKKSTRRSNV